MGPPISAFPMTPSAPTISVQAAGEAVRDLKRARNAHSSKYATTRNDEYRLARRSRKLAKDFEGAMEKSVRRKLNNMSGSQNNRKVGLKVAQFIPGKGLEVAGVQSETDPTIYCSLGVKGDKHVDPLDETFSRIKGRQVSMDFAFKLICDNNRLLDHDKYSRVTAMNCFRHLNPDSFNYEVTGWQKDVGVNSFYVNHVYISSSHAGEFSATQGTPEVFCTFSSGTVTATGTVNLSSTSTPGVYRIASITVDNPGQYTNSNVSISILIGPFTTELVVPTNINVQVFQNVSEDKIAANENWHSTLGPDASFIRHGTRGLTASSTNSAGTWRGSSDGYGALDQSSVTSPSNSLISPYRYPTDMEIMYSRVNRQLLENYGWLLNPFKFVGSTFNSGQGGNEPSRESFITWSNPGAPVMDFNESDAKLVRSYPAQVNQLTEHVEGELTDVGAAAGYEWHSQMGPGKLSYQFSNDGTNPVCIDICVVGVKKNNHSALALFKNFCDYNYAMHKFANKSNTNVNGFQCLNNSSSVPTIDLEQGKDEWHSNGKMPFMPDQCFKNPQSFLEAANYTHLLGNTGLDANKIRDILEQGKSNPYKVVKRDQFIVSSGATRSWNTTLPSINYRPQLYDDSQDPIYPLIIHQPTGTDIDPIKAQYETTADEYTYMLCIGASGIPKPVEEVYSASRPISLSGGDPVLGIVDAKTIIDRQPTTCNVSVVGTYKEVVYPCYPKDRTSVNFINGRLTEPYFEDPPGYFEPNANEALQSRVNTVDISQLGQVVHTTPTGIVGVGAITTDVGA